MHVYWFQPLSLHNVSSPLNDIPEEQHDLLHPTIPSHVHFQERPSSISQTLNTLVRVVDKSPLALLPTVQNVQGNKNWPGMTRTGKMHSHPSGR